MSFSVLNLVLSNPTIGFGTRQGRGRLRIGQTPLRNLPPGTRYAKQIPVPAPAQVQHHAHVRQGRESSQEDLTHAARSACGRQKQILIVIGSRQHGLTHRARGCFRKMLTVALQLFDLLADKFSKLLVIIILGRAVTDAAPREEVRSLKV